MRDVWIFIFIYLSKKNYYLLFIQGKLFIFTYQFVFVADASMSLMQCNVAAWIYK